MVDAIRAFIAIPLPAEIRAHAGKVGNSLRENGLRARWARPENLHLTLRFLGDIRREAVRDMTAAMSAVAGRPLRFSMAGLGVFPSIRKARVLWMALSGDTAGLLRLHADLAARLAEVGGTGPDTGAFKAHVTLARFPVSPRPEEILRAIESHGEVGEGVAPRPVFTADRMVLYESRLTPEGPIYTRLFEVPLTGGPDGAPSTTP